MANSIARWLLDEASSGTGPTECADSAGDNTLTIDYSSGDAAWTSVSGGNGLDFTAAAASANSAIAELADIATNGDIGSSFDAATSLSCLIVTTIDNGHAFGARLLHIGTNSGNGDFGVLAEVSNLIVRWDQEGGGQEVDYTLPSGLTTIGITIDTTESTGADRCKVYYDGSLQTSIGGVLTINQALDDINATNRSICIGNRPSQNRNIDGKVYYAELFTGQLTATEHSDAHTALSLDNDADPFGSAPTYPLEILQSVRYRKRQPKLGM